MKKSHFGFLAAGLLVGAAILVWSGSRSDGVGPLDESAQSEITDTQTGEVELSKPNSNLPSNSSGNSSGEISEEQDGTACLDACLAGIFDDVLMTGALSVKEMNRIVEDPKYLKRFLKFNPEMVARIGTFLGTADVGEEGGDDYDEDLDNRVMLMEDVVAYLSERDLTAAASEMVNSDDPEMQRSSLTYIKMAFQKLEDKQLDLTGPDAEFAALSAERRESLAKIVTRFLDLENNQRTQLHAMDILSRNSPEHMSDHMISLLTNMSTQPGVPEIRGRAMVIAARSAESDSLVLTQISDELRRSDSDLHLSALRSLDINLRKTRKGDTDMIARLSEFKIDLEALASDPASDPNIARYAAVLLERYEPQE